MGGNSRLWKVGVILDDSSATDSRSANCFSLFPEVGTSAGRERYGEISAILELRREDINAFRAVAAVDDDVAAGSATTGEVSLELLLARDGTSKSLQRTRSGCLWRLSEVEICLASERTGESTTVSLKVGTREDQSGVRKRLDGEVVFGNKVTLFNVCGCFGSIFLEAEMESEFKSRAKCGSRGSTRIPFSSSDSCLLTAWSLPAGIASLYCGEGVCGSPVSAEDELDSRAPLSPDM